MKNILLTTLPFFNSTINKKISLIFIMFFRLSLFAQTGSLDLTFNPGTGANNDILANAIQSDGKIIIGGYFTSYNGTTINRIARLNIDGSLDTSFHTGTGTNSSVLATAIQGNGKILLGGYFTNYNGTTRKFIARVNIDGSLDAGFNAFIGVDVIKGDFSVKSIAVQNDGKILIGGNLSTINGATINGIARLNTDGSLDTSFSSPVFLAGDSIEVIAIQNDGKILLSGWWFGRLNSDGSLDASFNSGIHYVQAISIQNDGRIIFGRYNYGMSNHIGRLNSDGSLDTSFNTGTGTNYVMTTAIQNDEKIIIGGAFSSYNGTPINGIARLNTNGSLDMSFNPGTGANGVWTSSIKNDGKIIIGGWFTEYNGIGRNRIALLLNCNPVIIPVSATICSGDSIFLQGNFQTSPGTYYDTLSLLNGCDSVILTTLTVNPTASVTNTVSISNGDSIFLQGEYQFTAGTFYDTLTSINGCDSIVINNLTFSIDTCFLVIYDTTIVTVNDTVLINVYNTIPVFDTTTVIVTDTIPFFDSTFVTVTDTIIFSDTNTVTINDTVVTTIFDTTFVTVTDTSFITVYDSISVTDTLIIDVNTGLTPPNNFNTVKVYPNPAKTHIYIDNGNYALLGGYKIAIENSLGQEVFFSIINQQQFYVDLSGWTGNGAYFVKIIDGQNNTLDVRKIILQ